MSYNVSISGHNDDPADDEKVVEKVQSLVDSLPGVTGASVTTPRGGYENLSPQVAEADAHETDDPAETADSVVSSPDDAQREGIAGGESEDDDEQANDPS